MNTHYSCEELLEIVNDMIDGNLEGKKLEEAEKLLAQNPQCSAMFQTVRTTINLYRMRRNEIQETQIPELDWDELNRKLKDREGE